MLCSEARRALHFHIMLESEALFFQARSKAKRKTLASKNDGSNASGNRIESF